MLFPPFLSVCSPARRMVRDRRSAETQMEGRNQARETESGMVIKASRWAVQVSGVGIFARSARSVSPMCWDGWPNVPLMCHARVVCRASSSVRAIAASVSASSNGHDGHDGYGPDGETLRWCCAVGLSLGASLN